MTLGPPLTAWQAYRPNRDYRPKRCSGCSRTSRRPGREGWTWRLVKSSGHGNGKFAERRCRRCALLPDDGPKA
jgi:hypothetical protein